MQTLVDIDDDVMSVVRVRADQERASIGHVLSALARSALAPVSASAGATAVLTVRNGIPLLPGGGHVVTSELVRQLQEELT
jgi:hypothetical protein